MKCFNKISLNKFEAKNAFVRSATCEYMSDKNGFPEDRFIELYKNLAEGGIGTIITGYSYVMPNGKSNPGQSGIYSDDLIPTWKKVTEIVKVTGSRFLMQIVHGGRQVRPKSNPGPVWAPSAVPDPVFKTTPHEMTEPQIEKTIDAFINAAARAREAGFDGIQLHVAHGYLLSQFISPYTNHRTDAYGGNQEKRTKIVINIIEGIKKIVDERFILSAKINCEDFLAGGLDLEESTISAKLMKIAGLDFIEVSGGMAESKNGAVRKNITSIMDEGYFLNQAKKIRKDTGIPVAAVGGFRTLTNIENALNSGFVDMVSLCRPFIREPDLVNKFKKKSVKKASCISCNRCFNPRGLSCWYEQSSQN